MSAGAGFGLCQDSERTESLWMEWHQRFAGELLARMPLRDGGGINLSAPSVDERLVQAIWHDQMLRGGDLVTASGKSLQVIESGRWNTSRGPDFLDARLRVAGQDIHGDIEIHVESADWTRHGHQKNFEYNNVVLHVVLRASDDRPYEEKQNGERLERLVLEHVLETDIETIRSTINLADYPYGRPGDVGICHDQFLRLAPDQLQDFLTVAGRARMEAKIARFQAQMATAGFLQCVYQALLTAQGFKSSKTLYFLLSKRAPVDELLDHARDLRAEDHADFFLSVYLHVAQLMPSQPDLLEELDEETRVYTDRLKSLWQPARPYFSDRLIPPTRRWYAGMRPAGFPPRRLAAVALLLQRLGDRRGGLLAGLKAALSSSDPFQMNAKDLRQFWTRLTEPILVEGDAHYFSTHFTLGGKKQKPQALLGEPAARSLLFNVLLPTMIIGARREKDRDLESSCWKAVYTFPALEKNSVVRFMENRLFGSSKDHASLFRSEIYQQALLKVFTDCCSSNERTCDDCTFLAFANAGRESRGIS